MRRGERGQPKFMDQFPSSLSLGAETSIELLRSGNAFLGFGAVSQSGMALRSRRRPMFVEIRNPYGVELLNYSVTQCEVTSQEALLSFSMDRLDGGPMEWMVHEVRPRQSTADWSRGPRGVEDTVLEVELRAVRRTLGGREYRGFSYRYNYRSDSIPIYKILDRGTWEIGGSAISNEFWMRNCFVPSITRIESESQFYSTEWYIPDCANPSAFQFLPWQTELQGFTFTASDAGVLVTWASEVAHVRSLFEKPRGEALVTHWHEQCGDLGRRFSTAPIEVLWSAGSRSRVDLANDYEAVREFVHETLHAQIGMRRERVTTFGQIEEWTPADVDRYRRQGLPKLLEGGAQTVYLANHFENNMNTWGVSNFCVTVDHKVSESVGEDKLRAFCRDAIAGGAVVQMWGNTAISTLALIFDSRNGETDRIEFLPREGSIMEALDRKTSFVRNPSNAIEEDHYTPVLAVLNLRDPAVRAYWLRRWKAAHDEVGLGSIFLDSSFNLSSDKFHYVQNTEAHFSGATADQKHLLGVFRPAEEPPAEILSQYRAHLDLMIEMQKIGYVYGNEDLGVFGIHRHGPALSGRLDSLFLWADCITDFDASAVRSAGSDPDDVFFRGLAYRMMWTLHWDVAKDLLCFRYGGPQGDDDLPRPWHLDVFRAYNRVQATMRERTILPGECGVLYRSETARVLWAFEDLTLPLESEGRVWDVLTGDTVDVREELHAARRRVYLLEAELVPNHLPALAIDRVD
jgi:hypothetical protein